jgi:hypothetical protein
MIKAMRIVLSGEKSFDNATILTYEDQVKRGIPQIFGDSPRNRDTHDQLVMKCKDGTFAFDAEDVLLIHLDLSKPRRTVGHRVIRMAIGDVVFEDINVIPEIEDAVKAGFPNVLGEDQISIYTTEGRFLVHDGNCVLIQIK